ncbi:class I SAM-dependent methyltransferase [Limnospira platensis]|uniref:class I SAM-dependent methyltransferase n=1 Tax=Limnospira platensis TaxID=118562 RepID=UPI003D6F970D
MKKYTLTTETELITWYQENPDFVALREKMQGYSERDFMNSNLKLLQDLCMCDFIKQHIPPGAKVLEIGGAYSRILSFFKNKIEGWNLDKFEGIGNGPKEVVSTKDYKVIPAYIGSFDQRLPDGYFDLVFSISVLEHINEDDRLLKNIVDDIDRLLKPGGYSVHCIDCRFPTNKPANLDNRRMAKYIIQEYGFDPQYVIDNHQNQDVFHMSGKAYDKFWKKSCHNRPYQLDGLPFNIFLVNQKRHIEGYEKLNNVRKKYTFPNVYKVDSYCFELFGSGRDIIFDKIRKQNINLMLEMGCFLCGSSLQWLEKTQNLTVIGVDSWDDDFASILEYYNAKPAFKGCFRKIKDIQGFIQSVRKHGPYISAVANVKKYRDRFIPAKGHSPQILYELHDLGVKPELIYFDSNKTLDYIDVCWQLFPNAILSGDDWTWGANQGFPVQNKVNDFCQRHGFSVQVKSATWMLSKP